MRQAVLDINGKERSVAFEARTNLADLLRETLSLTATHIGCEHGVCGACTVLVDGDPVRSCITFAAACEGASITTLEGLDDDPVLADLRAAFTDHHALQCGYCTPGMLIACRDIVLRLPDADERRIRIELSGNLCRCTGYVGIVAATRAVLEKTRRTTEAARPGRRLGPIGAHALASPQHQLVGSRAEVAAMPTPRQTPSEAQWNDLETQGVVLHQAFNVPYDRARVWAFFADLERVARCMPGARLTGVPEDGRADGELQVKLGPIRGHFAGMVETTRNDAAYEGLVRASGRDGRSASTARARLTYTAEALGDAETRLAVSVKFLLTGPLAQFSRSGLIKDVADHMTAMFAANLQDALSGKRPSDDATRLDAFALARAALWRRIKSLVLRR